MYSVATAIQSRDYRFPPFEHEVRNIQNTKANCNKILSSDKIGIFEVFKNKFE